MPEAKAQEATERAKQAEEREQLRIIKEQEKEVQLEKKAQEEKAEAEKKKPKPKKAWGQMGKKAAAKSSKPASVAKKPSASIDTKYVHDHIKVSTKAFELSYGTPEVWFRGLSRIIGRAGAGAGEDEALHGIDVHGALCGAGLSADLRTTELSDPNFERDRVARRGRPGRWPRNTWPS